ncbi:MAG TPA: hypothetical protein VNR42_04335 [Solirubrobacteraceae bacterium]|nr:hypothetical protein [Solirubrobacteraceae bacterium]
MRSRSSAWRRVPSRPDQTDVLFDPRERVAVELGDPLVDLVTAGERLLARPLLDAALCAELSSFLEDRREQRDRLIGELVGAVLRRRAVLHGEGTQRRGTKETIEVGVVQ